MVNQRKNRVLSLNLTPMNKLMQMKKCKFATAYKGYASIVLTEMYDTVKTKTTKFNELQVQVIDNMYKLYLQVR